MIHKFQSKVYTKCPDNNFICLEILSDWLRCRQNISLWCTVLWSSEISYFKYDKYGLAEASIILPMKATKEDNTTDLDAIFDRTLSDKWARYNIDKHIQQSTKKYILCSWYNYFYGFHVNKYLCLRSTISMINTHCEVV